MNRALMLLGATASGKSALAHRLALEFDLEIVSLDSAQVYRELDIGSAKPSPRERAQVRYHLLDVINPCASFSVGDLLRMATACCEAIWSRGRLPLIVGGTMLYAKVLLEGINELPQADPELRQRLLALSPEQRWRQLQSLDQASAERLHANDSQRVQRALEVFLASGRSIQSYWDAPKQGGLAQRCHLFSLALSAAHKNELAPAIDHRLSAMLRAGWVDELRQIRERHRQLTAQHNSMRLIGYRRLWKYLEAELTYQQLRAQINSDTLNLAKRQLTWLRSLPESILRVPWQQPEVAYRAMAGFIRGDLQ